MVAKLPHGWYKGKLRDTDIIDTIESSIGRYDIALVELADGNELTQREREIPIKNRTKMGYTMATEGDGIDISSRMEYHRGTVQKGISQTIQTSCEVGVIEFEHKSSRNA